MGGWSVSPGPMWLCSLCPTPPPGRALGQPLHLGHFSGRLCAWLCAGMGGHFSPSLLRSGGGGDSGPRAPAWTWEEGRMALTSNHRGLSHLAPRTAEGWGLSAILMILGIRQAPWGIGEGSPGRAGQSLLVLSPLRARNTFAALVSLTNLLFYLLLYLYRHQ